MAHATEQGLFEMTSAMKPVAPVQPPLRPRLHAVTFNPDAPLYTSSSAETPPANPPPRDKVVTRQVVSLVGEAPAEMKPGTPGPKPGPKPGKSPVVLPMVIIPRDEPILEVVSEPEFLDPPEEEFVDFDVFDVTNDLDGLKALFADVLAKKGLDIYLPFTGVAGRNTFFQVLLDLADHFRTLVEIYLEGTHADLFGGLLEDAGYSVTYED